METHDLAENSRTGGRKSLVTILLVAAVLIIGLIVAIVVVNLRPGESSGGMQVEDIDLSEFEDIEGSEASANDALVECYNIRRSFTEGAYVFDEVKQEYEANMATDDAVYNTYITMCYADFVYNYGDGFDAALSIAELAKPLPKDVMVQTYYYTSLRDIYERAGNDDGVNYCDQMIDKLLPSDAPVDESGMGGEEE